MHEPLKRPLKIENPISKGKSTFRVTKDQAVCLDDLPELMDNYDYLKEKVSPGEKFKSIDQCKKAFGRDFRPHVKNESPFEDACRELWCSNSTHALRAHPALEGTDCNSKPWPYGSVRPYQRP